ncbi:mechanosensitive ion channel [Rhizobium sp. LjRoot30]|uniref:mechanosensitive ion channel family protein n=1 Tax=Rhizobium sp. LjRoot30 TaxID=3342320 RepID=UPI003ED04819
MDRVMVNGRPWLMRAMVYVMCLFVWSASSHAQQEKDASTAQPANVREFLILLDKPDVQQWLKSQTTVAAAPDPEAKAEAGIAGFFASRLAEIRSRVGLVADGAMNIRASIETAATRLRDELSANGPLRTILQLLCLPLFAFIGDRMLSRRRLALGASAPQRRDPAGLPSAAGLAGFIIGAILPLVLFGWTDLLKHAAVVIALALVGIKLVIFVGRVCVGALDAEPVAEEPTSETSEADERVPASHAIRRHWYVSIVGLVSYFLIGWSLIALAELFGVVGGSMLLLVYVLAFGLFAIALWALWSRPQPRKVGVWDETWTSGIWSAVLAALLFFWLAGLHALLWIGLMAIVLPFLLPLSSRVVRALLNDSVPERRAPMARVVLVDRGLRAIIVALSVWWLAHILGLEATNMASGQTVLDRVGRGVLQGVVVAIVADLLWAFAKAQIEARMQAGSPETVLSDDEKSRASRLRTLLPILRNVLAAAIGIVAILMVLAGLGIEIAPLLAGAGVVGVAVGFGAQTVVKDVISGVFYLWDDAFRIGEYIESGKFKGEVESFSLRSVKLRHHRGPLTTVPFGELGAVQNMSRDWAVTKFNLRVGYDTDLEQLRKVIKKVGQELAEIPEYKDNIISPLKMKGVVDFGEYAIEVRVGFTTKPGEQFMIRRQAMTMIRSAFRENGIHFAVPTVQVSNSEHGDAADAAVAQATRLREQRKQAEIMATGGGE